MATDINMSLDDIIKKNKTVKSFNPRRRPAQGQNIPSGRKNNARSGGGGGKSFAGQRFRNISTNRPRQAARFSPYKRGDIEGAWDHDLYEDGFIGKRIDYDAVGTKITISNLEFGVTDSDLEELFLEIGPLLSCEIHYDKSGRSLGSGSVVFEDRVDAIRAMQQYNGVPLDGRAMEIEITPSMSTRLVDSRRLGNFRNRNSGGGGSGGGGGGRRRFNNRNGSFRTRNRRDNMNLSMAQLDAELDEMCSKTS